MDLFQEQQVSEIREKDSGDTLLWIEKYRPDNLEGIISHQEIISVFKKFVKNKSMPHLMLYGPPGSGKTSTIMACASELYGKYEKLMVLELNASDERGIEVVRQRIKQFVMSKNVFCDSKVFKLVILDETDAMTRDAQAILRQIIEKFTYNARFCLICNYISKISSALQSRCTPFRFAPLTRLDMKTKLQAVIEVEGIDISEDGIETILKRSGGDMRKALNILQSTHMIYAKMKVIDSSCVNTCIGYPLKEDIEKIINCLFTKKFDACYRIIKKIKAQNYVLADILQELHEEILRKDIPLERKAFILSHMADIEVNLSTNTSENIQLCALIGIFKTKEGLPETTKKIEI